MRNSNVCVGVGGGFWTEVQNSYSGVFDNKFLTQGKAQHHTVSHTLYVETNQIFALQTTAKARFTELCANSYAPRLLFS